MTKKIYAVNGSPRLHGNTAQILEHFIQGAASEGAETKLIQLGTLTFSGCKSCFACKRKNGASYGKCVLRDEATPILEELLCSDGVAFGTPVWFSAETGIFRNFMERLLFSQFSYDKAHTSLAPKRFPTAFFYTMNITSEQMAEMHYAERLNPMQNFTGYLFSRNPPETLYVCDTFQFDDYSKYESSLFDPVHKAEIRAKQFPEECRKAFEFGRNMAKA